MEKHKENLLERLEAVQCIVSTPCDKVDAHCAWEELDHVIPELRKIFESRPSPNTESKECPECAAKKHGKGWGQSR